MTIKTFIQKDGTEWSWEENEALLSYIKMQEQQRGRNNGNTQGKQQNPKEKV